MEILVNKKLTLLLSAMSLFYAVQLPAAAGYFKTAAAYATRGAQAVQQNRAARFLWNNKFALTGTGIVGYNMNEYKESWDESKTRMREFSTLCPVVGVSPQVNSYIREQAKSFGIDSITLVKSKDGYPVPYYAACRLGEDAYIILNAEAEKILNDKVIPGILKHELTHIEKRHTEKSMLADAHESSIVFLTGAFGYKLLASCEKYMPAYFRSKLFAQLLAVAGGAALCFAATKKYELMYLAYSRHFESEADQGVFKTSDRQLIESLRACLIEELGQGESEEIKKHWYLFTHPLTSERIAACDKALEELDRLENGESDE